MDTKEAYKAKFESQVAQAQVKLLALKALAKEKAADGKIAMSKHIDGLEQNVAEARVKLTELAHVGEDKWAEVKAGLEGAWAKVTESFKTDTNMEREDARSTTPTPEQETAMKNDLKSEKELEEVNDEVLNELTRRVQDIDNTYRAVAEKMGQLYMRADENKVASLTRSLDKPMRNASDNEQMFAAILNDLRTLANRRK